MQSVWIVIDLGLIALVVGLAWIVLGALRSAAELHWRIEQFEAAQSSRVSRRGLKIGAAAPEFRLPNTAGGTTGLADLRGRGLLLLFTQDGCGPCHRAAPAAASFAARRELALVVINNGAEDATREFAHELGSRATVLRQERFEVSKRYEVYATPFAFVIDPQGRIQARGFTSEPDHFEFLIQAGSAGGLEVTPMQEASAAEAPSPPER